MLHDRSMRLEKLTQGLRDAFLDFAGECAADGDEAFAKDLKQASEDFPAFVRKCEDASNGVGVPEGYVPWTSFWLVEGGRILGEIHLRHSLTEALRDVGGHIGYTVRPTQRRKGCGTEMLKLALPEARKLGLDRVMITCDKVNTASARVIQKNGGVLESEGPSKTRPGITQRYWIEL